MTTQYHASLTQSLVEGLGELLSVDCTHSNLILPLKKVHYKAIVLCGSDSVGFYRVPSKTQRLYKLIKPTVRKGFILNER